MAGTPQAERGRPWPLSEAVLALWVVVVAALATLGADLMWVVALGDDIRADAAVPDGLPFASAPQVDWPNPLVLAELLLSIVNSLGTPALAVLQLALVAATLAVTVVEARRLGGRELRMAAVISLVVVGGSAAFVVVRLPGLSLLPFVLLVALLRRQHDRPSRALWLAVPLLAVWGNLHGGVLVGAAVLAMFLVASPAAGPLWQRVGVGVGTLVALMATSAGPRTLEYYLGVLGNEARARGTDLWAPTSLAQPLDVAMILAALVLLVMAARRHMPLWEWLVVAGVVVQTVMAARNGIWLLLFLAPAAAAAPRRSHEAEARQPRGSRRPTAVVVVAGVLAVSAVVCVRTDGLGPKGAGVVAHVAEVADGRPVLADEPLAETLAQGGVTVWASNPIDAFPHEVQGDFLDFLADGRVPPAAPDVAAVAVEAAPTLLSDGGWATVAEGDGYLVLERTP